MNQRQTVRSQLDRWPTELTDSASMLVQLTHSRAVCEVLAGDRLALSLERVACQSAELADWDVDRVKQLAKQLAARLTYLLEPIAPIEIDQQAAVVQMRSQPPTTDDDRGRSYYELRVDQSEISLVRFRKPSGEPRHVEPMTFTREVVVRLLCDVDEVLGKIKSARRGPTVSE